MCACQPPDDSEATSIPRSVPTLDQSAELYGADHLAILDRATQLTRRRAATNALANYGQYAVAVLAALFLQGYVIRKLGKDGYALWPLVLTCTSFFMILPVSISASALRFLAAALGGRKVQDVSRITTSIFAALVVVAIVFVAAVVIVSVFFEGLFNMPPGVRGIGPWAMLLGGLAAAVRVPFSIFRGGLEATQNFIVLNVIELVFVLARVALVVLAFAALGPSLIWFAGAFLVVEAASSFTTFWAARRFVPWQKLSWKSFDWKVLSKLSGFSMWMLAGAVAGRLYWETDNILINKLLDPVLLTGYFVVVTFVRQCQGAALLGSSVLFPSATVMHARGCVRHSRHDLSRQSGDRADRRAAAAVCDHLRQGGADGLPGTGI